MLEEFYKKKQMLWKQFVISIFTSTDKIVFAAHILHMHHTSTWCGGVYNMCFELEY